MSCSFLRLYPWVRTCHPFSPLAHRPPVITQRIFKYFAMAEDIQFIFNGLWHAYKTRNINIILWFWTLVYWVEELDFFGGPCKNRGFLLTFQSLHYLFYYNISLPNRLSWPSILHFIFNVLWHTCKTWNRILLLWTLIICV